MSECLFTNGSIVKDYGCPYIVCEVNSSHGGSIERAKKMIDTAVDIGCDCVKFQSWSADSLYSKTYYDTIPFSKRFVSKFSFSAETLKNLADYCNSKGIAFASTPYNEEEVDFLIDECKVPFIKISSMEINNLFFLEYIGKTKAPVVLSTGMSSIEEIERAVDVLLNSGTTQMVLLHCVSIYPTIIDTVNLNNILMLREKFSTIPIGFSDHTEGDEASVAAVALGAGLIEKHLTLDKTRAGMDNGMATEPEDFRALVKKCHNIQLAMGKMERVVNDLELEQRKKMRRSVIVTKNIKKGEVINKEDLYAKRPGTGISPDEINYVVGKRAARDLEADTILMFDDII